MEKEEAPGFDRRKFLQSALVAAGGLSLRPGVRAAPAAGGGAGGEAAGASPPPDEGATVYLSFGPKEAAFTEALVNILCPADGLTPSGVDCGLALFIDRQMAGGFGKGERLYLRGPWRRGKPELGYQHPLTPEEFFKAGLAAADAAARARHGREFAELETAEAEAFLHEMEEGRIEGSRVPLAEWFNELVYPLFLQACFADPIYGGNRGKVFWRMIGYPGLPAMNTLNVVKYRGKPFPGARSPKSIEDFS